MSSARLHPVGPLERALQALKNALAVTPMTDVVRDGALHRFEFTMELSWKTIAKALTALGRDAHAIALFEQVKQFPPLCEALLARLRAVNYADIG